MHSSISGIILSIHHKLSIPTSFCPETKYQLSTMLSCKTMSCLKAALRPHWQLFCILVSVLWLDVLVLVLALLFWSWSCQDQVQNSAKMNDDLLEMLMYMRRNSQCQLTVHIFCVNSTQNSTTWFFAFKLTNITWYYLPQLTGLINMSGTGIICAECLSRISM